MHAQTQRQREVLDFITRYIDSHGYRPSYQVIARQTGVRSRAGIARIVGVLESQGLLTRRRENGHFYIDVGGAGGEEGVVSVEWLEVPERYDYLEQWQRQPISVPTFMLGVLQFERIRAYRVPDNGLIGENICDGDVVLVELRQFPRDGERVVAVLDDRSSVLRRYYRIGSEIDLRSVTFSAEPETIQMPADRVLVKGVARALLRPDL